MSVEMIQEYLMSLHSLCPVKGENAVQSTEPERLAESRARLSLLYPQKRPQTGIHWWDAGEAAVSEAAGRRFFPEYLEDKKWSLSFRLQLQKDDGECVLFLVEHGQKRVMSSSHDTEFRKVSNYSEEEQAALMEKKKKELDKIDRDALLFGNGAVTDLSNTFIYPTYGHYMLSTEHYLDREFLLSTYEHTLYRGITDHYYSVSNESVRYDILYALGSYTLEDDGYASRLILEEEPVPMAGGGAYDSAPGPGIEERLAYYLPDVDWQLCTAGYLAELEEIQQISALFLPPDVMTASYSPKEAGHLSALLAILAPKLHYFCFPSTGSMPLLREFQLKMGTNSLGWALKSMETVQQWEASAYQNEALSQQIQASYQQLSEKQKQEGLDERERTQLGTLAHGLGNYYQLMGRQEEAEPVLQTDCSAWLSLEPDSVTALMGIEAQLRLSKTLFYRLKFSEGRKIAGQALSQIERYWTLPLNDTVLFIQIELLSVKGCCETALGDSENGLIHIRLANEEFEDILISEDPEARRGGGVRYILALKMQAEIFRDRGFLKEQQTACRQGKLICSQIASLTGPEFTKQFIGIFDAYDSAAITVQKEKKKSLFSRIFS